MQKPGGSGLGGGYPVGNWKLPVQTSLGGILAGDERTVALGEAELKKG